MKHVLLLFYRNFRPPPVPVYLILPNVQPPPLLATPAYSGPVTTEFYFIKSP